MTKSEYRKYISSEHWQRRRKEFLSKTENFRCRCGIDRDMAVVAYDQDFHVHHRSYANLGAEPDSDLQALCRRCHEIKTFGSSVLHELKTASCRVCGSLTYNRASAICWACFGIAYCESAHKGVHQKKRMARAPDGSFMAIE